MTNTTNTRDKTSRGNASQFFVAGELCRRGLVAVVTMGNTPNTDILCSNSSGTKFVHVQVKTFIPGRKTVTVGKKAERFYGDNFIWVLAGIPLVNSSVPFEYFVIPSRVMSQKVAEEHQAWLSAPGINGRAHRDNDIRAIHLPPRLGYSNWDLSAFSNKWSVIEDLLA